MPDIIDELMAKTGRTLDAEEAPKAYRPSSYNPFISVPQNLWEQLKESYAGAREGVQELGEGRYAKGAWDIGMGGLQALGSPVTAGIQTATYPLAEYTGIPEPALTGVAQIASGLGAGRAIGRGLGMLGRGGRAAEAAGAAGAAGAGQFARAPRERMLEYRPPMPETMTPPEGRTRFDPYEEQQSYMRDAAGRSIYGAGVRESPTSVVGIRETTTPKTQPALAYSAPWEEQGFSYAPIPMRGPSAAPVEERYAPGYTPGGIPKGRITDPARMLEFKPAMPDLRPRWQRPQAEMGYLMPDESARWARPEAPEQGAYPYPRGAELPPTITDPRRMLPDYTLPSMQARVGSDVEAARNLHKAVTDYAAQERKIEAKATRVDKRERMQALKQLEAEAAALRAQIEEAQPRFAPERPRLEDLPERRPAKQLTATKRERIPREVEALMKHIEDTYGVEFKLAGEMLEEGPATHPTKQLVSPKRIPKDINKLIKFIEAEYGHKIKRASEL